MKFLRDLLDKQKPLFEKGGRFEKLFYIWEANETCLFAPNTVTKNKGVQIRDAIELKRRMMTVIISMVPCLLFGIYNVGHQHFLAIGEEADWLVKSMVGLKVVLPIIIVSYAVGLGIEFIFSIVRGE